MCNLLMITKRINRKWLILQACSIYLKIKRSPLEHSQTRQRITIIKLSFSAMSEVEKLVLEASFSRRPRWGVS